jgi:hypothetical protein
MDCDTARSMALDMPGTLEREHFGRPSYSVKKKIYITLWIDEARAVIKLTPEQQIEWSEAHPQTFIPVDNKWGKHGWTNVLLAGTSEKILRQAIDLAWRNVSPKWLLPTRAVPGS